MDKVMTPCIEIKNLTKNYGDNRGIFDINLEVYRGEIFGLVGINGAGKTTLIRHLMGFLRSQNGTATILGKDCRTQSAEIMKNVAYIPGEIAFPNVKKGTQFFKLQAEFIGQTDTIKATEIAKKFNLDATAPLKRMSKGMKQKSAIVTAFMGDKDILIFDEPTTGLDPLMQKEFSDILLELKKQGKTVFMSSHIFDEMEHTCDRVAVIKDGRILEVIDMKKVRGQEDEKEYKIEFNSGQDYKSFTHQDFNIIRKQDQYNQITIRIANAELNNLFKALSLFDIKYLSYEPLTLREEFNKIYRQNIKGETK
jgi:ABC-2 type transport system ATP-binding protein